MGWSADSTSVRADATAPTADGYLPSTTRGIFVRTGGAWTKYTPNVRVSGAWIEPDAYVRVGGAWVQVHTKPPNLYPNALLAGGGNSGPSFGDANLPPTSHTLGFRTVDGEPVSIGNGAFEWNINRLLGTGRCYLTLFVDQVIGAGLEVGKTYQISYEVTSTGSYAAAMSPTNATGITVIEEDRAAIAGTKRIYYIFRIDSAGYTLEMRTGVGTTGNRSENIVVRDPRLVEIA